MCDYEELPFVATAKFYSAFGTCYCLTGNVDLGSSRSLNSDETSDSSDDCELNSVRVANFNFGLGAYDCLIDVFTYGINSFNYFVLDPSFDSSPVI